MRRGSTIEVRCPSPSPPLGARKGRRRRRRALTAPSLVLLLLARLPNPTSCPPLAITPPSLASPRPVPRPASPAARVPRRPPLHRLALPVRARLGRVLALQPDAPEGRAHARRPGRGRVRPPSFPPPPPPLASPFLPVSPPRSCSLVPTLTRPPRDLLVPPPASPSSRNNDMPLPPLPRANRDLDRDRAHDDDRARLLPTGPGRAGQDVRAEGRSGRTTRGRRGRQGAVECDWASEQRRFCKPRAGPVGGGGKQAGEGGRAGGSLERRDGEGARVARVQSARVGGRMRSRERRAKEQSKGTGSEGRRCGRQESFFCVRASVRACKVRERGGGAG